MTCQGGFVFVGRVVESMHDLDGEVVEYLRHPLPPLQRGAVKVLGAAHVLLEKGLGEGKRGMDEI